MGTKLGRSTGSVSTANVCGLALTAEIKAEQTGRSGVEPSESPASPKNDRWSIASRKISMGTRPRTKAKLAKKAKRCTKCGALVTYRVRCKKCSKAT
jgi:hypothetical protein